ncbi:hypothetical protein BD769DRAFT_1387827 [Suillus cothurnatus]|nr:hypothetical protein BD769DRAFT_1387827 [Suillus cothurnatus]
MSWHWTQYREERVLASNALALDVMGYKRDLARVTPLYDSCPREGEVKQRIDVARHGDTCNTACASSFSDDNQWEFMHQWSETDVMIQSYNNVLNSLMQQFQDW